MRKVTLLFGVHNHQPVGNFDGVFEQMYARSYEPFVRILRQHPRVKCTFHVTGPLWEWVQQHRTDYQGWLADMARKGQVELFTGGMYEPILPILPERDQTGQIRMMTDHLQKHFGVKARGLWLAERVWEPHLPRVLRAAGVEYLPIDDAHFKSAGFPEDDTYGYYLTEEQGATVGVFPISEKMRYLVPFRQVDESIDFLRSVADESGDRCVVLMDDGEKFGGWPDTYDWVFEQGWLDRFFNALEQNADWIATSTFSEWFDQKPPKGLAYLPAASYTEMGEWSLMPDAAREYDQLRSGLKSRDELARYERFIKGGFWRNFLFKYTEANHLHKRMTVVSERVEELRGTASKPGASAARKGAFLRAQQALYRGQCNCPYWHGIFGGLYLNHLRFAVYRELLEAEKQVQSVLGPPPDGFQVQERDFNCDGRTEILVASGNYRMILEPGVGGSITELDFMDRPINLSDVLTRRPEVYHDKLRSLVDGTVGSPVASIHDAVRSKEPGLAQKLWYDAVRRASLLDRFLPGEADCESLRRSEAREAGDFLGSPFEARWQAPRKRGGALTVDLTRRGHLLRDGKRVPLRMEKKLVLHPGDFHLEAELVFTSEDGSALDLRYFNEWNLTLLAGRSPDRRYYVKGRDLEDGLLASSGEESDVREAGMTDGWLGLQVSFSSGDPMRFWRYPVETISQSEGGFERVYQGSCLLFGWDLKVPAGGRVVRKLCVKLSDWKG